MNAVVQHAFEAAVADELERQMRYRRAWEAYHGQSPGLLKVREGDHDDNVRVNFARALVDKGVSFLFGKELSFEIDQTQETPAERWLDACWRANRKALLLQKLALNGAVCGHAWLKLTQPPMLAYPRLIVIDPANVAVGLAIDDIERVDWYRIQYTAIDPRRGELVVLRQWIVRSDSGVGWDVIDEESRGGGSWQETGRVLWAYDWPPLIDCQNLPLPNEYFGVGDLEDDVLELCRAMDFVLSNTMRIIRFHAHPKTWARGIETDRVKVTADELIILESDTAELHNLEMESDLASSLALYERLREALHDISRVPEIASGRLDRVGHLSGLALQLLYQPLLEKTQAKRNTYGEMLVELNRRLLELGGWGSDMITELHWPELLPEDTREMREVALMDDQLGVSRDTLLRRLGYDPELEQRKRGAQEAELGEQLLAQLERGEGEVA
ncbi:MAG: phage portal protein [Anaerolineales bacterium]|nr:phage portal protein [Anaerolineales bacterium]